MKVDEPRTGDLDLAITSIAGKRSHDSLRQLARFFFAASQVECDIGGESPCAASRVRSISMTGHARFRRQRTGG